MVPPWRRPACGRVGCCDASPARTPAATPPRPGPSDPQLKPGKTGSGTTRRSRATRVRSSPRQHHPLDQPTPGPAGRVPSWQRYRPERQTFARRVPREGRRRRSHSVDDRAIRADRAVTTQLGACTIQSAAPTTGTPGCRDAAAVARDDRLVRAARKGKLLSDYHRQASCTPTSSTSWPTSACSRRSSPPPQMAAGDADTRWDTCRISELAEILAFYGLPYWYAWQVSVLGLGPVWMSANPDVSTYRRAPGEGGIFAFGLSEREHGADIYSTDMVLTPNGDGSYLANGGKYYIGNGNQAAIVSIFGHIDGSTAGPVRLLRRGQQNPLRAGQERRGQPDVRLRVRPAGLPGQRRGHPARRREALDAALNTVNVGKFNLGFASIGMCTHAFYEAITHAPAASCTAAGHRLPPRESGVRRRLRAAGGHEAVRRPRDRLLALGLGPTTGATCSTTPW